MVFYCTPHSPTKNLRDAYDAYAALVQDDDWLCFQDRDIFYLTGNYANIIEENLSIYENVGLFTCLTNRVGNLSQCYKNVISKETDILKHYEIAERLENERRNRITFTNNPISGYLMVIQKKTYKKLTGLRDGLLGVDTDISKQIVSMGLRIAIMEGLYVFHYYRLKKGIYDKSHLV